MKKKNKDQTKIAKPKVRRKPKLNIGVGLSEPLVAVQSLGRCVRRSDIAPSAEQQAAAKIVKQLKQIAEKPELSHTLAVTADNIAQSKIRDLQAALKWAHTQAANMEAFYAAHLSPKDMFEYRRKLAMCKELLK